MAISPKLSRYALRGRAVFGIAGVVEQHWNVVLKVKAINVPVRIEDDHRPEFIQRILAEICQRFYDYVVDLSNLALRNLRRPSRSLQRDALVRDSVGRLHFIGFADRRNYLQSLPPYYSNRTYVRP